MLIKEGKEQKQAIAICHNLFDNKSKAEQLEYNKKEDIYFIP